MESCKNIEFFEEYYDQINNLEKEGKYLDKIKLIDEIESKIFDGVLSSRDNKNEEKSDFEVFKENPNVAMVYNDKELSERCIEALKRITTQPPDRTFNEIDSWFTQDQDLNTVTVGSKSIIKCTMVKMLAILAELDLMSKFSTKFEEIIKLQAYSIFRWLVRIRVKMPLTFSNRELILMGFGCINPEDNSVFIPFRSVNNDYYKQIPVPPEDGNYVRIDIIYGFINVKYIDAEHVEMITCYNVDPKVPVIPWFILNTFVKEISYYIMEDLKHQIEAVENKVYDERIKNNPEFYNKVDEVIKDKYKQI